MRAACAARIGRLQAGDEPYGSDTRQEQIRRGLRRHETRKTVHLDRRSPIWLRHDEAALRRILGTDQWVFRPPVEPDGAREFAVVDPTPQHELVLVLDVRVDEVEEHPPIDPVVRPRRIIGRPVRQTSSDQPVRIVAAAGDPLARDRLTSWIDTSYVRADGTEDPFRISRVVGVDVLEIVQPFGGDAICRAIRVRRQRERNAVAPSPAELRGQQFRIDPVLVRLQEVLEGDDVGLDLLEDREAAVQTKLPRLGNRVVRRHLPAGRRAKARRVAGDREDSALGHRGWWACVMPSVYPKCTLAVGTGWPSCISINAIPSLRQISRKASPSANQAVNLSV